MTLAPLLRKMLLIDLFKGMSITFRYQAPKEIQTEQYPLQRPDISERWRGQPRMNVNPETGETLCIACELCALACPEKLISMKSERDPVTKRKVLTAYTYDMSRCMFCGLCEQACPSDCLELSQDYEMALYSREGLILDRARMERGPETKVYEK